MADGLIGGCCGRASRGMSLRTLGMIRAGVFVAVSLAALVGAPAQAATSILEQVSPTPTAYVYGQDYGIPGIVIDDTIVFGPRFVDITSAIATIAGSGVNSLSDGCSAADYGSSVSGKIALIARGSCAFVDKAFAAQQAGALAVLIADNDPSVHVLDMSGFNPAVSITAFRLSYDLGALLATQTLAGPTTVRLALGNNLTSNLSAAPEPSAWATMVVGFGMISGVLRRRRHFRKPTDARLISR